VLAVIENTLGIERGHIETIHSYTNDQNLLDNYHKNTAGVARLHLIWYYETRAAKAVAKSIAFFGRSAHR